MGQISCRVFVVTALALSASVGAAFSQVDLSPIETKLESVETWDRINAVRDLMRLAPSKAESRPLLQKMMADAHPDVRMETVWAVNELLGADGIDLLEKLYGDSDSRVRDSAIRAACRQWSNNGGRDLCTAAFDDPDAGARVEVLNTLKEYHARDPRAAELFRKGLSDPAEMVQRGAVFGAQAARDAKSVPGLTKLARTASDLSAVPAVEEALATIATPEAVQSLISLLPKPKPAPDAKPGARVRPSDLVRAAAARALARVKDPASIPALRPLLEDASLTVRIGAMEALMQMKDTASIPAISAQLTHPETRMRRFALRALRTIGDPSAAAEVRRVLREDKDEEVRATAALTISDLLGTKAIPDLLALREDLSPTVRLQAAGVLAGLGKGGADALAAFMDDRDHGVRLMAVEGLGQVADDKYIPLLAKAAEDSSRQNLDIRIKVAEAMGRIGSEQALPTLVKLAKDSESAVRQQVARSLGRVGGTQADAALAELMKDPVATVRNAARKAKEQK